jgi:large-conductance mechanosensitive channel
MNILPTSVDASTFVLRMKQFILENNLIGTAAGVCIALSTKDVVTSFVGDVIIPGIQTLLLKTNITFLTTLLQDTTTKINFNQFFKLFVSWIFIVIITFLFVTYGFYYLLGINDDDILNASVNKKKFTTPSDATPTSTTKATTTTTPTSATPMPTTTTTPSMTPQPTIYSTATTTPYHTPYNHK